MSERKKPGLVTYSFVIFIVLLGLYILFNSDGYFKHNELKGKLEELRLELDTLRTENRRLKEEIDSLQKQYDAKIEQVAREKHNMKKENEKVIRIEKK